MKIPKILLGTGKEVHPRVTRMMTRIKKSREWPDFSEDEMVETDSIKSSTNSYALMYELDPSWGTREYFRLYAVSRYYKYNRGVEPIRADTCFLFDGLVKSPWGILTMLCTGFHFPLMTYAPERNMLFFEKIVEYWDTFLANKHVLANPDPPFMQGEYFWNSAGTQLWYLMAQAGVPKGLFDGIRWNELGDYQARDWVLEYIL